VPVVAVALSTVALASAYSAYSGYVLNMMQGPKLSTYNPAIARQRVFFAAAAYCPSSALVDWSCEACTKVSDFEALAYMYDSSRDSAGFVGQFTNGDKAFVVSFRGPEPSSVKDWVDDLEISKLSPYPETECDGCQVHDGFYQTYMGLRGQLIAALNTHLGEGRSAYSRPIHVTGHSLGGALATIAAYDLKQMGYNVVDLITFGSPRVGNQKFAMNVASVIQNSWRIVHNDDIVPPNLQHVLSALGSKRPWFESAGSHFRLSHIGPHQYHSCNRQA
jgi:hypothetical protein